MFIRLIVGFIVISAGSCQNENDIESQIRLRYYVNSRYDDFETPVNVPQDLLSYPGFDLNKMTVFYFHGFIENVTMESVQTIIHAYLHRGDHNLVIVDWSTLSESPYLTYGAPNAIRVGRAVGTAIYQLGKVAGIRAERVHLVGHSLGGQAAGFAGKRVASVSRHKVNRISLLDAAAPGFYGLGIHVKAADAAFVDAIHTDAGIYGARLPTATVDFWPNGGARPQPGCPGIPLLPYPLSDQDVCSHWRSWRFWAESLLNEQAFPAWNCKVNYFTQENRVEYINEESAPVYMGFAASRQLEGNYCLNTKSLSPFGSNSHIDKTKTYTHRQDLMNQFY